jgi:hypothetical protein
VIQLKAKTKISKKPKKKVRKATSRVAKPARRDDGFTPEDIAEMNMFSAAIAKMNWEAEKKNWAKTVAEWKKFQGAKREA